MNLLHVLGVFVIVGMQSASGQEVRETPAAAIVPGELRQFAIASEPSSARDTLHRAGWVEADGRLLRQQEFPELYAYIGRAYTRPKIAKDLFAVPNLIDRRNEPNPYGVLGPGDLITSGTSLPRPPPPTYFICVGKDARSVVARWK